MLNLHEPYGKKRKPVYMSAPGRMHPKAHYGRRESARRMVDRISVGVFRNPGPMANRLTTNSYSVPPRTGADTDGNSNRASPAIRRASHLLRGAPCAAPKSGQRGGSSRDDAQ